MDEIVDGIRAFNRFTTVVIGVMDRRILRSPYSLTEVRVLYEISRDPRSSARRIRAVLDVDEGYLSRTISGLVRRGLVSRKKAAGDGRVYSLSLSGKGERELSRLEDASTDGISSLISGLSVKEKREVLAHMRRIQELLSRKEGRGNARA